MKEIVFPKFEDGVAAAAPGLSHRTELKCMFMSHAIVFEGEIEKAYVKDDSETQKTYAIWFHLGGAIELVIENDRVLRLWDSYGVDVSIVDGHTVISPHIPGGDRAKWATANVVFSG